tara:strand:+ start:299 stop:460 length:162 start_codon:yes stop_codon:yes gene_type:complete
MDIAFLKIGIVEQGYVKRYCRRYAVDLKAAQRQPGLHERVRPIVTSYDQFTEQ